MIEAFLDPLRRRLIRSVAAALLSFATAAFAQAPNQACGPLANAYGPYDYRTDRGNRLYLVEMAHFTPEVESLIKGNTGYIGADLDYTLRAYPNHHRALISAMRYGEKTKSPMPPNMRYSVECYFERALRFRPDDTVARMLYATFLEKSSRPQEADAQLQRAGSDAKDNGFTHYNIGLIYLDGKNYDRAIEEAHKAIALGFPRDELKERLVAAGKWREPANAPSPAASSAPPQSSASAATH